MPNRRRSCLALLAVAAAAWAGPSFAADPVRGSGVVTTVERDLGPFTGIAAGGSFTVKVRVAAREHVQVVADDNVAPLVETSVHGSGNDRVLKIEMARGAHVEPRTPVVVNVDVVRLERVAIGGSGSIEGRAFRSPRLDAAIGGSGTIALGELDVGELSVAIGGSGTFRGDGRAQSLAVRVGGSGHCDAERIRADEVSVAVAGSGDARVHAERALSASISGTGDVFYSGAATPQVAIAGSGRVKKL